MQIICCDLCDNIIKPGEKYHLIVTPPNNGKLTYSEYQNEVNSNLKEICVNCKNVIAIVFRYRLKNLNKIKKEIDKLSEIPKLRKVRKSKKNAK